MVGPHRSFWPFSHQHLPSAAVGQPRVHAPPVDEAGEWWWWGVVTVVECGSWWCGGTVVRMGFLWVQADTDGMSGPRLSKHGMGY